MAASTRTSLAALTLGSFLALGATGAAAQAVDCMAAPPADQDLTLVAAYAASPPAVDETAFTMEVENILANTYGGDLVQYRPVYWTEHKICGAGTNQEGEKQVMGRWAESWTEAPDGKSWQFKLRRGIKSFRGNEMTCADYQWTWARGFDMKAVRFFFSKVLLIEKAEDVTCPDPYTVQFKIKDRNPLFLQLLAMNYYGGPFDSTEAKKHATTADPWAKEWLKTNTAGFGPYHMEKHVPGEELILVRNPGFSPRPAVGRVIIKIVPDSATRLALLKRGQVDYAMRLRQREYNEIEKDANLQVAFHPANFIPYFGPVQTNPIMAKPKVRQALAWAMPYQDILNKVYFGRGDLIRSITPKIYPNSTEEFWPYREDLAKAKQVLAEAGYPNGFEMTISYDKAISEMEEVCTLVKSNLEKIGIKVQLQGLPSAVYSDTKFQRKQMAHCDNFQWPWVADTGYTAWVYLTHPEVNVMNAVKNDDPELNKLTEMMFVTAFGPERLKMDRRIQQRVGEDVPWIFLVNPGWREAMKKGWEGFTWYPDNNVHFERLYKKGT
ncbi:MAG: ABC transporter substrate-binding protein [Alphaproteobacteria bacterium]|nr:ABC transporter substrate-binding protein [Alphaproteobacteria bacterium]